VNPGRYGFKIIHETDKAHFFSSDQHTVVREWMKAITKATIQRDFSSECIDHPIPNISLSIARCSLFMPVLEPVISSSNIPTIPLAVAQAMSPAPRPPSPTARYGMENALLQLNLNSLSSRDALALMGLPPPPGELKKTGPSMIIPESPSSDSETSSRESPSPDSEALSLSALQKLTKFKYPRKPRTPSPEPLRTTYVQPLQTPPSRSPSRTAPRNRSPSRIAVDKPLHSKVSESEPRMVMQYGEVDDRIRRDRRPVPRFEETIRNDMDLYYTRRRHSDGWSIERAGVLTVIDTGDWPDAPSSPVYIVSAPTGVHQATPRRSISLRTTVGATTDAKGVRMTIPRRSSSVRHSSASSIIVPGTAAESIFSFSSRTTMSARIGSMLGLRANPSPRSSIASEF